MSGNRVAFKAPSGLTTSLWASATVAIAPKVWKVVDRHSVTLRVPPLPRSTGERKGASSPALAPFLSLRRGERWRREAATEWGKANLIRDALPGLSNIFGEA